ncbi:recombination endonuclease subunit [Maribacter phage Molly_5]|uniref:Recombination endonuclease subunit n=1 Tax=Maribacter phage Molly_1 TaxID=2745685 RepID=A0A8E4XXW9_9CAUD|nr:recombination endonuclease subunit [Maribacter phage Molly_1]QQO97598.1 recombination endonuclease subunit [Maribacter phage Molly_2]QQO97798.1 recombination endonuclease subunit [Maribacter phage Molly_3]QQO97999.1 recombination endonuclease subunit [Maribacter phage Molly_4]QQO98199.1 recombination endonuclease subunit [Maribacter phage Molly_5]QQO97398.1 recombination endonuclease subunit [Maribacter phage Molly_1]
MRKLVFESIELTNFMSYRSATFPFERGIHSVRGYNLDDPKSTSNGAGKSTLFDDAINFLFYGSVSKPGVSANSVVNDRAKEDCSVKAIVKIHYSDKEEKVLDITRYRAHTKHGNELHLIIDGVDYQKHGIRKSEKVLLDTIGISQKLMSSVFILSQGMGSRFSMMSNIDRKYFIENLRDNSVWDNSYAATTRVLSSINVEISNLSLEINKLDERIRVKTEDRANYEANILTVRANIKNLNLEEERAALLATKTELETQLATANTTLTSYQEYLQNYEAFLIKFNQDTAKPLAELTEFTAKKAALELNLTNLVCNSCKRPFKDAEQAKIDINKELDSIKEYLARAEPYKLEVDTSLREHNSKINDARTKVNTLNRQIPQLSSSITNKLSELSASDTKLNKENQKIETYTEEIVKIDDTLVESNKLLEVNRGEYNTKSVDAKYQEALKQIFSFKGIRSFLISTDIVYLNTRLRDYSVRLFTDLIIQFEPIKASDGSIGMLEINAIKQSGLHRPFSNLSTGQRRRADICIQFAIKDLAQKVSSVYTNLLVADEPFEGLDSTGVENVLNLLFETTNPDVCLYIISHRDLAITFRKFVHITLQNEESTIDIK